jgi:ankyrin repeat protein
MAATTWESNPIRCASPRFIDFDEPEDAETLNVRTLKDLTGRGSTRTKRSTPISRCAEPAPSWISASPEEIDLRTSLELVDDESMLEQNENGNTLLHLAILEQDVTAVRCVLKRLSSNTEIFKRILLIQNDLGHVSSECATSTSVSHLINRIPTM